MPGLADRSKKIFNALKSGKDSTGTLSMIPAAARRRMLIDFARKQEAATSNFFANTSGTVLDTQKLHLQKDGSITAPHDLAHEYPEEAHQFWINDVKLSINPTDIHISQDAHHIKDWVMRTAGMAKVKSGRGVIFVSISVPFVRADSINNELRRLIAQIRTIPIAYIDNPIVRQVVFPDDRRKNMAAAITGANISTHPESPEVLVANISMEIFNYTPFSDQFFFASIPVIPMLAPSGTAVKLLKKSKAGPANSMGTAKIKPKVINRPFVVKTPAESLLFTQYYNFILGDSDDLFEPTGNAGDRSKLSKASKRNIDLVLSSNIRKYNFKKVADQLSNTISFTYYIYHMMPQSVLGLTKLHSKVSTASPFSDAKLSASASAVQGLGAKGGDLRKLASGDISALVAGDKRFLYSKDPGVLTGKRILAKDFARIAKQKFLKAKYSNNLRLIDGYVDCSAILYRTAKLLGIGNIGSWTIAQIATLETLNNGGVKAFLKMPDGQLIPMPLSINGQGRSDAVNISKFGRIPGLLMYSFKKKVSGLSGTRKVYRPTHAGVSQPPTRKGKYKVLEALSPKSGVKVLNYTSNHSKSTAWERAYFIPNGVYSYKGNEKEFNLLFGISTDGINLTSNATQRISAAFKQVRARILTSKAQEKTNEPLQKELRKLTKRQAALYKEGSFNVQLSDNLTKKINALKAKIDPKRRADKDAITRRLRQEQLKKISKPVPTARSIEDQQVTLAKNSRAALKYWVDTVSKFEEIGKQSGWELLWQRDGTAIFRKPVTLTIDPLHPRIVEREGLKVMTPTQITVSVNNVFARLPLISQYYTTHQYLGSGDAEVNISFHVTGNSPIGQLEYMHKYNESASRTLRRVTNVGVIGVKNDIINLVGCDNFIIDKIQVSTVPQSPELYSVQMKLTEWKRDQNERGKAQQEFAISVDAKKKFIQRLAKSFNENAKAELVETNRSVTSGGIFGSKVTPSSLGIRVTLGTGKQVTLKSLKASKGRIASSSHPNERNTRKAGVLDPTYIQFGSAMSEYIKLLNKTNIFHFLGWDRESFIKATNDPSSPLYSFGLMEILTKGKKNGLTSSLFESSPRHNVVLNISNINGLSPGGTKAKKTTVPRTFAVARFFDRITKLSSPIAKEYNKRSGPKTYATSNGFATKKGSRADLRKIEKIKNANTVVLDRYKKTLSKGDSSVSFLDKWVTTGGVDAALLKLVKKHGQGTRARPGSFPTTYGFTAGLVAGALNAASGLNLLRGVLESIDRPTSNSGRRLKAALGPKADSVVKSYPKAVSQIITGFDITTQKTTVATSTLHDEIRLEQVRLAIVLVNFFKRFRNDIAGVANVAQSSLALKEGFKDIFETATRDNINYGGLPAYQDIPLPRAPIADPFFGGANTKGTPQNVHDRPKQYRWTNPDFFFYNTDDVHATNLELFTKFEAQTVQMFSSSLELAYQFGMVPSGADATGKTSKASLETGKGSYIREGIKGTPGMFAYLGGHLGKHSGEIGYTKRNLSNNLPDTLSASRGLQKIQHSLPHAKFASGKLNAGIGLSGISNESQINPNYIDNGSVKVKAGLLSAHQKIHPLVSSSGAPVERVSFGPQGMSEFRLPVLLDRNPQSIVKTFQKSMVSYQRNAFKMRRAFPAFKLYFIEDDTGSALGTDKSSFVRSHDDFFSFSAIKEIKFVRSRKVPADLVIIRLSNLFGYLDDLQYSFAAPNSKKTKESTSALLQDTTAENPFTRFVLKEGVRVQLRLGYENDPDYLDTEFNGQIVQINQVSGDEIVIVCQSFATQLVAYKKGLQTKSIPHTWVDTFDLLAWAIAQPEVTYFGRWQLNSDKSFLESRSTGGWEKTFQFLADPRDDNVFAPSRHEMLRYSVDDHGGLASLIFSKLGGFWSNLTSGSGASWVSSHGKVDVFAVSVKDIPVWDPDKNSVGIKRKKDKQGAFIVKEGDKKIFYNTYARGDSGLLDYHVFRTTIWDIFKEMELRHPGWIAQPVPFGNRMTMFFGQPNQLYWYRPQSVKETMEQNSELARMHDAIRNNTILNELNGISIKATTSWWLKAKKAPVLGHIIRNPWTAISIASIFLTGPLVAGARTLFVGTLAKLGGSAAARIAGTRAGVAIGEAFASGRLGFLATKLGNARAAKALIGTAGAAIRGGSALAHGARVAGGVVTIGLGAASLSGYFGVSAQQLIYANSVLASAQQLYAQRSLMKLITGRLIPFRRYHLATSEHHIIANTIKASVHNTYNAISLEYTTSPDTESSVSQDPGSMSTKTMKASDRVLDKDIRMGHFSFPNCKSSWMADRYMQGLLIRYMKDTYKGQLLLVGDAKVRPHDRVLVMDSYTGMVGPVDVEQVIHTITPSTGFLTEITPDLVLYGNNIIDMPYDDYMSAKIAFDKSSWSQSIDAALRFRGAQASYKKKLRAASSGINADYLANGGTRKVVNAGANIVFGAAALTAYGTIPGGIAGAIGLAAGAGVTSGYNSQLTVMANLTPFFGSMAIKLYEWTTQRQPLIFQPLYVAGRPLLAGVSLDKVGMIQNIEDKFLPVLKKIDGGFNLLAEAANSIGGSQFKSAVRSALLTGSDETGRPQTPTNRRP